MPDRAVVGIALSDGVCTRCGWRHPIGLEGDSCMTAARVEAENAKPQPRAVVDELNPRYRYQIGSSGYWVECDAPEAIVVYPDGSENYYRGIDLRADEPQPRALVALSEDRQWLVVLNSSSPEVQASWRFYKRDWKGDYITDYRNRQTDTGQDAHAVLAAWLSERQ